MRRVLRKILEILDGTPAEYGKKQRGQSLVEFALTAPLLAIMLIGLAEIGWLANNYLILLEVSRVGARRGTVLVGDEGVLNWDNRASLVPVSAWPLNKNATPQEKIDNAYSPLEPPADETVRLVYRGYYASSDNPTLAGCGVDKENLRFFNLIACQMIQSMDPLRIRMAVDENDADNKANPTRIRQNLMPDDIVVSAFALQLIDNPDDLNFASYGVTGVPNGPYLHVVGRYPSNANECTVGPTGNLLVNPPERDPFDFISNIGYTPPYEIRIDNWATDDYFNGQQTMERQRGFAWTGQHKVLPDDWNTVPVDCIGSQWTIARVEDLINMPDFNLSEEQRQFLPTQGLVITEIYWQHELLAEAPGFSNVYQMLGPRTTISAWAAFPAPSAEPAIKFD